MKEYKLSKRALKDYRDGAKKDKNLDAEILRVKFNCLINSARKTRKKLLRTEYIFARCIFTVNIFNIIISIRWDNTYPVAEEAEIKTLFYNYKQCGLNRNGNKFVKA